ncbi:MAG: hypothetical protein ACYDH4_10110 [Candidatus Cryosericum sp.]
MNRNEQAKLRKLAAAWGGIPKLSEALSIHRATLYRYMSGELPMPKHTKLSCNFFAEHVGIPVPFDDAPPIDDDLRKFFSKHLRRTA